MNDFIFDGKALSDYGYILCSFNGMIDETVPVSNMEYTTIKAPLSDISVKISSSYPENLSTTRQICKNPCLPNSDYITDDEISTLSRWLCRKDYKWFCWNSKNEFRNVYYEAQISMNKIIMGDYCVGLELVINTNRPYAVTPLINIKASGDFNVDIFSDEEGYIYPDVTITCNQSGSLVIKNKYDNSSTMIKNCSSGEIINIYGNILQISSSLDRDISNDFNYVFPHLCNEFNNHINSFEVNLDCDISMSYRGIRKVGM